MTTSTLSPTTEHKNAMGTSTQNQIHADHIAHEANLGKDWRNVFAETLVSTYLEHGYIEI